MEISILQKYPNAIVLEVKSPVTGQGFAEVFPSGPHKPLTLSLVERIEVVGERILTLTPTHFKTYDFDSHNKNSASS